MGGQLGLQVRLRRRLGHTRVEGQESHLTPVRPCARYVQVGYNLMEHVSSAGLTFLVNGSVQTATLSVLNTPATHGAYHRGRGIATLPGGVEGLAYVHTKHNDDNFGRPDVEFIFASSAICADAGATVR